MKKNKNVEKSEGETKLDRVLTVVDLTLLGVGSTLGGGVYVLSGEVGRASAGPSVIIAFFIAAVSSILSGDFSPLLLLLPITKIYTILTA